MQPDCFNRGCQGDAISFFLIILANLVSAYLREAWIEKGNADNS